MPNEIDRNAPCPCGSGKKYKRCCARSTDPPAQPGPGSHDGGVRRAIAWLEEKHHETFGKAIEEALFGDLNDEEKSALAELDGEFQHALMINVMEYLLADGSMMVDGREERICKYLLGPHGPLLSTVQRAWLAQLGERPLRFYDVTDVVPGQQMTLCDALDNEELPIVVFEKSGTMEMRPGVLLGARLMQVDTHWELSGAVYAIGAFAIPGAIESARNAAKQSGTPDAWKQQVAQSIRLSWLRQYLGPPQLPKLVDALTNELMLLITDHYQVKHWDALETALGACDDVKGDRESGGWERVVKCDDGQRRTFVAINVGKGDDKLEVFYKTQGYADRGRPWFEDVAGTAVQFQTRAISDPVSLARRSGNDHTTRRAANPPDIPPEVMSQMIEQGIRRTYATWSDAALPALGGKCPREALRSPAGLERVKGLLRSYEANEARMAAAQARPLVSYDFLWDELGISR